MGVDKDPSCPNNNVPQKTNVGVNKDPITNSTISGLITGAGDWRDNRDSIDDKDMLSKMNNPAQDHGKML